MAVEQIERIETPPEDGKTVEGIDDENLAPLEITAISKLKSPGQQFDVLKAMFRADLEHGREWRRDTDEWFAFRAGEQWTPEDKAMLDSQQRPHIVFNRVLTILKAVAGMEINGRHEIHFIPRNTRDTAVNEVLSAASKWMADECDAEDEQSEAFDHCATCGMGFCLSDDALVRLPNTHFATTRLYSGRIVQIGLENGKELTGTPNHPVLTEIGWKRLCDLKEGDNLVNSTFLERIEGLPVEQFDHVETRLKDKINAFRTGRESLRVFTSPDDFYSDGVGSKVHVVYADRSLLDKIRDHPRFREFKESLFTWRNFLTLCRVTLTPHRHRNATVYASIQEAALKWVHFPFSYLFSGFIGTKNMAIIAQSSHNGHGVAVEFFANLNGRKVALEIEPSDFIHRQISKSRTSMPTPHYVTSASQADTNSRASYSKLIADFFDWKPLLEIEARKLISGNVGTFEFLTAVKFRADRVVHDFAVHDVGTSLGFFIAGNIITSNTEQRMSYEDDPDGLYLEEAIFPLELVWDRTAKKRNLSDARRVARVRRMPLGDAMQLFPGKTREQLDAVWAQDLGGDYPQKTLEEKRKRDTDNMNNQPYDDTNEVTIVQMQWIEREPYWLVADVQANKKNELSDAEYKRFCSRMAQLKEIAEKAGLGPNEVAAYDVHAARLIRKVYKQVFMGGELLTKVTPAPIKGKFSWDCITGEFDAKKGTFFGLVKVMRDPQMWANKWLSQILHILNTTAKGGIIAEEDAFADQRETEQTYAKPDAVTWAAAGSLSGDKPKIMPKPGGGMTEGYVALMTFAIASIKDTTGINLELLGQQDQNQPGIIEAMRKQAGMTVLATLFNALRRYRKNVGRGRLYFIQNFLSDGRLIRVVESDEIKAIPLAKDKCEGKYGVVVDDAPTSPNQKEANWAIIQPLLVVFKDQLMANPQVFAMLLEYSPLPSRIVEAVKSFVKQASENPETKKKAQIQDQLATGLIVSEISKNQSVAELNLKKAGGTEATAMIDVAMARNLLSKQDYGGLDAHLQALETASKIEKNNASIETDKAKTEVAQAGAITDAHRAAQETHAKVVGGLIDHLSAAAGVHRDLAAAHKDRTHAKAIAAAPPP